MITLPQHSLIALLKQLGVATLYALLLYIGEGHFESGAIVGYFEPASGLALAALLIGGKRYVLGVLLGAVLIHTTTADFLWETVAVASGDTLQALCGAWLLTRDGKFDLRLQSLRDYLLLILLGGVVSIAAGALAANTLLVVSGLLAPANYFHSLIQWWMSDTLGVILIAPLILAWLGIRKDWRTAGMMAEATLILGLTILACQAIFLGWGHDSVGQIARSFWMFLIVTWVAIRIGTCGTTVILTMTAIYALLGAIHGVGFFANDIVETHLVNYWLFTMTLSVVGMALATHFTERKQLEQQLSRRLRHRDVMERISRISLSSATIEELLGKVLDEMLTVFNADRAYFLYPCGPDAPSWSVPMERTRPEWPGAFASGLVIPMTHEVAEIFRELLASTEPLTYDHDTASRSLPAAVAEQFSIRSMMQMVLRPRVGSPWVMGLHHCAQARVYDEDERRIFKDIGRRVADALSSMIVLKNLHESEANLRAILDNMQDLFYRTDQDGKIIMVSASAKAVLGYEQEDVIGRQVTDLYAAPEARAEFLKKLEENEGVIHGYEIALRHKDGHLVWVSANSHFFRDRNGTIAGVEGVGHDITEHRQAETVLRESQARQSAILNNLPYLAWLKDTEGRYLKVNKAYADYVLLKDDQQVIGKTDFDLWPRELAEKYRTDDAEVMASRQQKYVEEPSLDGDRIHWTETFKMPVIDDDGTMLGTTGFARDITERKKAELALKQYKVVIDTVNDGFWITDAMGNLLEANAAYARMSGYSVDELLRMHASQLEAIERYVEDVEAHIEKIIARGHERFETRHRHKDGHEIDVEVSATFMPELQQFFVFIHDITKRKQAEEQIRNLAFYDTLTQLPNRRLLNDRLGQTMAASKRSGHCGALMFLDLDNFKPLNDAYGHGVGDLLLIEVAHRLTGCVREADSIARFGGDEFVAMLGELDADLAKSTAQARIVAEKIRSALAKPYLLKIQQAGKAETTVEHHCSASIGVVVFISEFSAEDVLKQADTAMYQAKERGRNQIYFFDSKS